MSHVMPRRKNKRSMKQGTEKRSTGKDVSTIMKTPPTNPSTPLGSFAVFPREIRDEIYRHILPKRYKAFHSPALYFSECYDDGYPLDLSSYIERFTSIQYGSIAARPLDIFQGDTITRRSIVIDVQLGYSGSYATLMTKSPLFGALKQLTGFKSVTLRLTAKVQCEPRGTTENTLVEWERAGQWEKLFAGFEPVLIAMSEALEPALGNSVMNSLVYENDAAIGHRQIIFHPQDHVAAIRRTQMST